MRAGQFIEKYFWAFLILGIVTGLWFPYPFQMGIILPKVLLGLMLFFVFLKTLEERTKKMLTLSALSKKTGNKEITY